jgi:CubicO group peptidase (beta-lactamase class C family)
MSTTITPFLAALLCAASPMQSRAEAIEALVSARHEAGAFDGVVLVAAGGEVILERGFGLANRVWDVPNTASTRFLIASATKQLTAVLVLQLVEEGELDLEDRVTDHLPEVRPRIGGEVSTHHLLSHSSGIPDFYDGDFFRDHKDRYYEHEEFLERFLQRDLAFEPGSRGAYSSSNYHLLGMILERVTGRSYEALLRERILEPLGMEDTGVDRFRVLEPRLASGYLREGDAYRTPPFEIPESSAFAAGDLYATAADLARLDRALHGEELLGADSVELILTPHATSPFDPALSFGLGGYVGTRPLGPSGEEKFVHQMAGNTTTGFTSVVTPVVDDRHLIVLLTNAGPGYFDQTLHELSAGILRLLYASDR